MNKVIEIKELITELNRYRDLYYNKSISEVSDYEYDSLFDQLVELENKTGITLSNSPTATVGYKVYSKLQKTIHEYPMLSLDKTKDLDKLIKFVDNKPAVIMLKMDGLTVALTYENGSLVKGESRGNGDTGEDITENVKVFSNVPLTIPVKDKVVIFGEAIIDYETFNRINSKLTDENKYKNPRNLCSGSVRQLDSKICSERNVRFIAWRLVKLKNSKNDFIDRLEQLRDFGFEVVPYIPFHGTKDMLEYDLKCAKDHAKHLGLPIDGCVISFRDNDYMLLLGATGHHMRGQIAFKYGEDSEQTTLRGVEWSMGKTGSLCPVAIFDPVELAGSTVSRASLHNLSIMKDLNIKINSTVTVVKKNEIIPQIIECDSGSFKVEIPDICPICGRPTVVTKDNDTEVLKCTNDNCKGRLLGKLSHAVSKNALNIDGLSEATIEKFIELGWLNSINDIYRLELYEREMVKLAGFGKKSVLKLFDAIEASRTTTLDRFLYSLSIPLIGRSASKDISKLCSGDFDKFVLLMKDNPETLLTIEGFGETMFNSLLKWWYENSWLTAVKLAEEFIFEKPETNSNSNAKDLSGLTFCITGSLNHYANRDALKTYIEVLNGKVTGSVTSKTTYLINNDFESKSSKNTKAISLNIPIITEEKFIQMFN